ncbi:MAG TPA: helix-turn-helix domain-containing protein [Nocardioidaceae bacterium]|nr:helix-turn-helix domain-containing protein [Nocardioidaceae bacterium]
MASTRDRLLSEGMRLFGERGYGATSVAEIEAAAGLRPGSGSLYRHFASKEELLAAGLERLLADAHEKPLVNDPSGAEDPEELLRAATRSGLRHMDHGRDLSRLLFRGLDTFPPLLERFGDAELRVMHEQLTGLLTRLAGDETGETDWGAVAVVLQGAVAHYWLVRDLFGEHPVEVDEDRFVRAAAAMVAALLAEHSGR